MSTTHAQLLAEAEALVSEIKDKAPANDPKSTPHLPPGSRNQTKSITDSLQNSEGYAKAALAWRNGGPQKIDIAFQSKATFDSTSTGSLSYVNYQGLPVAVPTQPPTIRDLLAQGSTDLAAIPYQRETAYTNAATTVAEAGLKPEATLALEDIIAPVKKIAVNLKVTDEVWADFPSLRAFLEGRLRLMVKQREDEQILAGNGVGSNLTGILGTSGVQTHAKGADTSIDAIHKGITKINATPGYQKADGIVINPTDWQNLRLAKDANTQYYGGGPFTGAYGNTGTARDMLWGLPVVVSNAITAGTALVGAFRSSAQVLERQGLNIQMTNSDGDDFVYNLITIRVEERIALVVYQPLGFCTVTGI